jgi:hypothetical protein
MNTSAIHSGNDLFFVNLHNISSDVYQNNAITLETVFKEFQKSRESDENDQFLDVSLSDEYFV